MSPRMFCRLQKRHWELRKNRELAAQFRTGTLCALLANLKRDPTKRPRPWEQRDFFPQLPQAEQREQEPDEMLATMRGGAAMSKGGS